MEHRARLRVDADPAPVAGVLADLTTYPEWNDLVANAVPEAGAPDDPEPAWSVTLRARIGPFARSKQLRMIRVHSDHASVRFERRELDGRDHASWVMEAGIVPDPRGTAVELALRYDGSLWTAPLDGILRGAIERASARLPAYLAER